MAQPKRSTSIALAEDEVKALKDIAIRTERSHSQIIGMLIRHEHTTKTPFIAPVKK